MSVSTVVITADYNIFFIQGDDDIQEGVPLTASHFDYGEEWLIDAQGDRALVHAGQWGPILVTIQALDRDPGPVDDALRASWEDLCEASIEAPHGDLMLVSLSNGPAEESADMLTPHGPGTYRLRVAATGRTEYWDGVAPVDRRPAVRMLIQTWQAAASPRVLHQHRNRFTGEIVRHT